VQHSNFIAVDLLQKAVVHATQVWTAEAKDKLVPKAQMID